jgi:hypothetical protein
VVLVFGEAFVFFGGMIEDVSKNCIVSGIFRLWYSRVWRKDWFLGTVAVLGTVGNCGRIGCIGNCGELWSYWLYWELWGTMVVLAVLGTMENCGCIDLSANYGNRSLFYTKIYEPD